MGERKKFLVLGDIIVDEYLHVSTSRKAAEAKIPIWDVVKKEIRLGGAANVANNIRTINPDAFVDVVGLASGDLRWMMSKVGIDTHDCASPSEDMKKVRYVDSDGNIIFRCDNIKKFSESDILTFKNYLRMCDSSGLFTSGRYDALVISDYDKGTIDEEVISVFRDSTGKFKYELTVVDSKRIDLKIFSKADVVKLNKKEYELQQIKSSFPFESYFKHCIVTLGAAGAELRQFDHEKSSFDYETYFIHSERFPVERVKAVDVTGCGDTHTAAVACSLFENSFDIRASVKFANECAKNVVQKFGTSVCTRD